jgi:hypothetical protein
MHVQTGNGAERGDFTLEDSEKRERNRTPDSLLPFLTNLSKANGGFVKVKQLEF